MCHLHTHKTVTFLFGLICLLLLTSLLIIGGSMVFPHNLPAQVGLVVIGMATVGSWLWWVTRGTVERLFFSRSLQYRWVLNQPDRLAREIFDLAEAARLIINAAVDIFG